MKKKNFLLIIVFKDIGIEHFSKVKKITLFVIKISI